MEVSISLRQITSILDGPIYRVKNEIVAATGASRAVFVFRVDTEVFSHYASAADVERWPESREAALQDNLAFYRHSSVTRDWTSITDRDTDLAVSLSRVRNLASDLRKIQGALVLDRTIVITGAE